VFDTRVSCRLPGLLEGNILCYNNVINPGRLQDTGISNTLEDVMLCYHY
jgi:hypothetical protein